MRVLVACEYSGRVREAFRARGHDAWSCDLLESEDDSDYHIQADVLMQCLDGEFYMPGMRTSHALWKWDMMIAFPPCTDLCSSGARWFEKKRKDGSQRRSIDFFMAIAKSPIPKIAIENPIGIMSNIWRKPDQIIQPHEFGHPEFKATCLWLKELPLLLPTNKLETPSPTSREYDLWQVVHNMVPGPDRWKDRSRTYQGIANAMAERWG